MKYLKSRKEYITENNAAWNYFLKALGGNKKLELGDSPVSGDIKYNVSGDKGKNIQVLLDTMENHGITNPYTKVAILGVIGKESNFIPKSEKGYGNTSNSRIKKIFGKRVSDLSDSELESLKKDEKNFFDKVYGGRYGNTSSGDGYKYRGRGFNQVTFKGSYEKFQKLINQSKKLKKTVNLISNPDQLNDPEVAAEVAILFFLERSKDSAMKSKYGVSGINEFKDKKTAIKAMANANAGWGKNLDTHPLQPHKKAEAVAQNFNIDTSGGVSLA